MQYKARGVIWHEVAARKAWVGKEILSGIVTCGLGSSRAGRKKWGKYEKGPNPATQAIPDHGASMGLFLAGLPFLQV